MNTWTMKHWGAIIGAAIVLLIIWLGLGATALVVLGGIIGYFVGKFLDGELNLSDLQRRRRGI